MCPQFLRYSARRGSVDEVVDGHRVRPGAAGQVDAQVRRGPFEVLVVGVAHLDRRAVAGEHLDVQAERLELLQEDLEGLRDARLGDVLALDDRLVDLDPAHDVVRLDRQQLLQRVGRAVGLHGPALHLAEPLAAELGLTAQRLLRDHRVGAGGPGVDLVVHQVEQLEDVHVADGHRERVGLAGPAVEQLRLAVGPDHPLAVAVGQRASPAAR